MTYQNLSLELDHVVIFTSLNATEAKALEAIGLQGFGGTTKHGGLGTASTSFFFSNLLYLELFWVEDVAAAKQALEPLSLNVDARMNWHETGASPLGVMLRSHPLGVKHLTHLTITVVADGRSSIARLLSENRIVSYEKGPAPLMTLTFDNGG